MEFNLASLRGVIPSEVISQIPETALKYNINSKLRLAHFLAQCAHESGGFKAVTENLNYSVKGLRSVFRKYFPSDAFAATFERKPEKIANRVYANRNGNGNEESGDGWRFRGRGYIQLTGRENYARFDRTVSDNIIAQPDLVATKYPLASAAFFFDSNNLWSVCDSGADSEAVKRVSLRVNGGTNGLADRISRFNTIYNLLNK